MENDNPNQTTRQRLVQPISKADLLTGPDFVITACNSAALTSLLHDQRDIPGHSISFLASTASKTNSRFSLVHTVHHVIAKPAFSKLQVKKIPLINQIPINNPNHESTGCR
jgi:hypothetical protein